MNNNNNIIIDYYMLLNTIVDINKREYSFFNESYKVFKISVLVCIAGCCGIPCQVERLEPTLQHMGA